MDIYNSKFALLFKRGKATKWAITLCNVTFFSKPKEQVSERWHKHEDCHKKQWKQYWYVGFAILYCYEMLVHGYERNKFEIEANMAEFQ